MSVTQLNTYVRCIMEEDVVLKSVFVAGEVSNFKNHYKTGHFYFTLKDENAAVKAVMFRTYSSRLRFAPEDGMRVICRARASVYERDGAYQLYVEDMQPDGSGSLSLAFEQLKRKLFAEGLFDEKHKKPIPKYPETIAVVTSPTGAALQDILNILSRRWPIARVIVVPSGVQGENAESQLVLGIKKADTLSADTIIIGRGGGSVEDLWCFNSEALARAIFDCKTPVISAVGHETDFTICDFVADLRAPTPSAAAENASPESLMTAGIVRGFEQRLKDGLCSSLREREMTLERLENSPFLKDPKRIFEQKEMYFYALTDRLSSAGKLFLTEKTGDFDRLCTKLNAFSPLAVLSRGYSIATVNGKTVKTAAQLKKAGNFDLRLSDGTVNCNVNDA
mgnify:FL=1